MKRQIETWACGLCVVSALLTGCKGKTAEPVANVVKVKTVTVGSAAVSGGQGYSGTVEEMSGVALSFTGGGTLKALPVSEGQMVSRGQLIAVVDATSLQNAYTSARATLAQAQDAVTRMKMLHDNGSLPEIQWVQVQTQLKQAQAAEQIARKSLNDTRLYAPTAGYIAARQAEVGQTMAPGVPVVKLVQIDRVKVKIAVPEQEIAHFKQGQQVQVQVDALDGATFPAHVSERGVSADPLSRSYEVKAVVSNESHRLLPGMVCRVFAGAPAAGRAVQVAANVVQIDSDNRTFVWTVKAGKAQKTIITTGANAGNNVAVTSGLQPGDRLIVSGQQKVSSGMKVESVK